MSSVKIKNNTKEVLSELQKKQSMVLEIIGGKAESYAKKLCPVDTGNLRNSITHQSKDDVTEVIGTNVEYAPYVELGTRRSRAKPYLKPAVKNHVDEYRQIIESVLKG